MNRDTFIDLVKQRLGNLTDPTIDAKILAEMDFVQEQILEVGDFMPWFLLSEMQEALTVVGERRLSEPASPAFLEEWEEGCLFVYDATASVKYTGIVKLDYDVALAGYPGSGKPKVYDKQGDYFWLFPEPDAVYNMRQIYYGRLALPSSGDGTFENDWMKHAGAWFIGEVGAIIAAQYYKDKEAAGNFVAQASRGKQAVLVKDTQMKEVNKRRIMGG